MKIVINISSYYYGAFLIYEYLSEINRNDKKKPLSDEAGERCSCY